MQFRRCSLLLLMGIAVALVTGGCGGKLARTGCAVVTAVRCNGDMRLHYADSHGKVDWKRLECDNVAKDVRTVQKNWMKPAKYVETRSGGTLTFPDGNTVVYHDRYP